MCIEKGNYKLIFIAIFIFNFKIYILKVLRKSQFALKKKRNKNEFDNEDYVCPMDIPVCRGQVNQAPKAPDSEKLVVRRNSDPSPQERHLDLKVSLFILLVKVVYKLLFISFKELVKIYDQ